MHSAKALPSAAHSIYHTATKDSAKRSLPSAIFRALRKALPSVELALGKKMIRRRCENGNGGFAECLHGKTLGKY